MGYPGRENDVQRIGARVAEIMYIMYLVLNLLRDLPNASMPVRGPRPPRAATAARRRPSARRLALRNVKESASTTRLIPYNASTSECCKHDAYSIRGHPGRSQ